MSGRMEVTILGCGSSGGVPRADGNWGACDPNDPRNRRSRCSLLVRRLSEGRRAEAGEETTLVVDTAPDFRLQAAGAGIQRVDAVLYTHDHADQAHGIDDLRVFAGRMRRRVPCWMGEADQASLTERFAYIFSGAKDYPAICDARSLPAHGTAWRVEGPSGELPIITFPQVHGPIASVGYRFGDVAYSSDVSDLAPEAKAALQDLDLWIVDALRWTPHPTHADVQKALEWIAELKPRRAVLTNMHVDLDYAELARRLPPGVEPAFDGWRDEFPLET